MPSPRDIPQVKRHWHNLPYDKYIVKYHEQAPAYTAVKDFFLKHTEYTHLVVCPDDLEVTPHKLELLLEDSKEHSVIMGYCPLDETMETTYNLQLSIDNNIHPPKSKGCWIEEQHLEPFPDIFQVKYAGMACGVLERETWKKARWTSTQNTDGQYNGGNWDYAFCQDMNKLKIPVMVDKRCKFRHWRNLQSVNRGGLVHTHPYKYLWTCR